MLQNTARGVMSVKALPSGPEVDLQLLQLPLQLVRRHLLQQIRHQILLPRLPKHHPVDSQRALERFELAHLPTERERRNVSLDPGAARSRIYPIRHEIRLLRSSLCHGGVE